MCALGKGASKELLSTAMQSFPGGKMGSWSALGLAQSRHSCVTGDAQKPQSWLAPALSRGFPDISNPLLGTKPLPGNLLQEEPCALPSTPYQLWRKTCALFTGNLCPFLETKPKQIQWVLVPGSGTQIHGCMPAGDPARCYLWLSSWPRTHSGESMKQPL